MKNILNVIALFLLIACPIIATAAEKPKSQVPSVAVVNETAWLRGHADPPNGGWSPQLSPDGQKIAFLSSTLHTPTDLWIMQADGTGARRLTTRGVQAFVWAADSKTIRFKTVRKGFEEVLAIGLDGRREARVKGLPPGASLPVYSPDGTLFAITVPDEQKNRNLWIGTADGKRLDLVTEKIGVRSLFWHPKKNTVFYEAGSKNYGVGLWEIDLATMQSQPLLSKYIGTPVYSPQSGLVAFAYPTNPGEFEVWTMQLDGTGIEKYPAPRLPGRDLSWDATGKGVYYLGQDVEEGSAAADAAVAEKTAGEKGGEEAKQEAEEAAKSGESQPHPKREKSFTRVGLTSLWHLDLASKQEERVGPPTLHVVDFSLAPDGKGLVLAGLLPDSINTDLFRLDPASSELVRLTRSRASSWLPTPTMDSTKVAFFTDAGKVDTLKIVSRQGKELTSYPAVAVEADTRLFWLPQCDGLMLFSARGLAAFTEKGAIAFSNSGDHRAFLGVDVSIQADRVLLNSIPRYGETPGLYMLEVTNGAFVQSDLRFPAVAEDVPELYMQPSWSMDGKKIVFTDRVDLWTMRTDNSGRKMITKFQAANQDPKKRPAVAAYPVWSVKGDMLCYTVTVYDKKIIRRQLWVARADGSKARMLFAQDLDSQFQVYLPEYTTLPFFDYDDRKVIFTATRGGVPNIFSADLKTGAVKHLTEDGAIFPALLPEEDIILFTSLAGNTEQLMTMRSDGSGKQPFVHQAVDEKAEGGKSAAPAKEIKP